MANIDVITKRKSINLLSKLEVLKMHDKNMKTVDIANKLGLAQSTVRTIIKKKYTILATVKVAMPIQAKTLSYRRSPLMVHMEKLLHIFIEDCIHRRINLSQAFIREKALYLFNILKPDYKSENLQEFSASNGWFINFKKRCNLQDLLTIQEPPNEGQVIKFKTALLTILAEGGYKEQQLFHVDETILLWKDIPKHEFISHSELSSVSQSRKDHVTLLLGGNASGDCKLKPLLICKSENPHILRNISESTLPFHWTCNSKAWMTKKVFLDWYTNCFSPAVEAFCKKNNIPYKIFLLLMNAPGHPPVNELESLNPCVKVLYLQQNNTLVSSSPGFITAFKYYYLRKFLSVIKNYGSELCDFWSEFNILNAIELIEEVWGEVPEKSFARFWTELLKIKQEEVETYETVSADIVDMGNAVGLDLQNCDIDQYFENVKEQLGDKELFSMGVGEQLPLGIILNDDHKINRLRKSKPLPPRLSAKTPTSKLRVKGLKEALNNLEKFCSYIKEHDPNRERSAIVVNTIKSEVNCYEMILDKFKCKTKKQKLDFSLQSS